MNKEPTKKEIKETITNLILSKKPGELFSSHSIVKEYFSSMSLKEWDDIRVKYKGKVKKDAFEVKKELEEAGKIVFVKERERPQALNEKIYTVKKNDHKK